MQHWLAAGVTGKSRGVGARGQSERAEVDSTGEKEWKRKEG